MPMNTKDSAALLGGEVEQATAAPGEKRSVSPPPAPPSELCGKPVVGSSHPCDREQGHKGKHSYRGE